MSGGLLLDTHALLWWMADAVELPAVLRTRLCAPDTEVLVSAASVWEIGIKQRTGRLGGVEDYLAEPQRWHARRGFRPLPIDQDDARVAAALVWDHRDLLDRMLVAQSRRRSLRLATCDPLIRAFHPACVWEVWE